MEIDLKYMRRAIDLSKHGMYYAAPNPLVGAVIVDENGRIIGEGYHRKCGEAHAEVNAINSVADQEALKKATMYVTLEPCAHHGRTGPCADLIIEKGIPRVVIGTRDPFGKVNGKGVKKLEDAGVEVKVGVLEYDCRAVNTMFFTAHTLHRPYIALKWAQTNDGFMDVRRDPSEPPLKISSMLTSTLSHRLRALFQAIAVGSGTVLSDNPRLDTRLWAGKSPIPVIFDRRGRVSNEYMIAKRSPLIIRDDKPLAEVLRDLYDQGIYSLLVEGGATLLSSFVKEGLWDFARVEVGPFEAGDYGVAPAPKLIGMEPVKLFNIDGRSVKYYSHNPLNEVKNL